MSDGDICPNCGADNSDHIGVFNLLAGPNGDPIDTSKISCEDCNTVYRRR